MLVCVDLILPKTLARAEHYVLQAGSLALRDDGKDGNLMVNSVRFNYVDGGGALTSWPPKAKHINMPPLWLLPTPHYVQYVQHSALGSWHGAGDHCQYATFGTTNNLTYFSFKKEGRKES